MEVLSEEALSQLWVPMSVYSSYTTQKAHHVHLTVQNAAHTRKQEDSYKKLDQ